MSKHTMGFYYFNVSILGNVRELFISSALLSQFRLESLNQYFYTVLLFEILAFRFDSFKMKIIYYYLMLSNRNMFEVIFFFPLHCSLAGMRHMSLFP